MTQTLDDWQPVLNGRWVTKKSKAKGKGQHVYLEDDGSVSYRGPKKRASKSKSKDESANSDDQPTKKGGNETEEEVDPKEAARAAREEAKARKDAERKDREANKQAWNDWYRVNPKGWGHLSSKVKAKHGMESGKEGAVGEGGGETPSREFKQDAGKSVAEHFGFESAEKFDPSQYEEIKTNAYSPSQKRADDGKWTSGGGGSGSPKTDSKTPTTKSGEQPQTPPSDSSQGEGEKGTLAKFSGWMKKKAAALGSKVLDAAKSMVAKAPGLSATMIKKSAQIMGKAITTAADRYGDFGSIAAGSVAFLGINAITVGGAGIIGGALTAAAFIETRKMVGLGAAYLSGDVHERREMKDIVKGSRREFASRTSLNAESPVADSISTPSTGEPPAQEPPVDGEQPEAVPEGLAEYICEFIADFYEQMELGAPPDVTPEQVQPMLETMLQYITTQDQEPVEGDEASAEENLATDQHESVPVKNHWLPV